MSTSVAADPPGAERSGGSNPIARYLRWLHLQWPAGTVERLPDVREDGSTRVPGLYVVGDLTGIPLLKFSSDWLLRLRFNPFYELLETRVLEWLDETRSER